MNPISIGAGGSSGSIATNQTHAVAQTGHAASTLYDFYYLLPIIGAIFLNVETLSLVLSFYYPVFYHVELKNVSVFVYSSYNVNHNYLFNMINYHNAVQNRELAREIGQLATNTALSGGNGKLSSWEIAQQFRERFHYSLPSLITDNKDIVFKY